MVVRQGVNEYVWTYKLFGFTTKGTRAEVA
jgi:hypothetical protein